ncbi:hypothetical protein [Wolbachia endosymbiont of Protocalliphora sialia]
MLKHNVFVEIMDELDSSVMRWNDIIEVIEMTEKSTGMKGKGTI